MALLAGLIGVVVVPTVSAATAQTAAATSASVSIATMVPGLPTTVTVAATLDAGVTVRKVVYTPADHCDVVRPSPASLTAQLTCDAQSTDLPSVRVKVIDSTGTATTASTTGTLDLSARSGTATVLVNGVNSSSLKFCTGSAWLGARLVDPATGVGIAGARVAFVSRTDGRAKYLGTRGTDAQGYANLNAPLGADSYSVFTKNAGPWSAYGTVTPTYANCSTSLFGGASTKVANFGDSVKVSGQVLSGGEGALAPLFAAKVQLWLKKGNGKYVDLGSTVTNTAGKYSLSTAAVGTGVLVAKFTDSSGTLLGQKWLGSITSKARNLYLSVDARPKYFAGKKVYAVQGRLKVKNYPGLDARGQDIEVWYARPGSSKLVKLLTIQSGKNGEVNQIVAGKPGGKIVLKAPTTPDGPMVTQVQLRLK